MRRTVIAATAALVGLLAAPGCTSGGDGDAAPPSTPEPGPGPGPGSPVTLTVMDFNIEYGGTVVSFDQVVAAIEAADADVVVVNEAEGNTDRLARALGWQYWSSRVSIASSLPLLDPPTGGDYVYVETSPGEVAAVTNVHLPSAPYAPNHIRDGMPRHEAMAMEREVRLPAIRPVARAMGELAAAGVPTFVAGDFNSPAGSDWTTATVGERPQLRYPMAWPAARAMAAAGFTDSYRALHPDPVADPGLTWPAGRPRVEGTYNPPLGAPADRIDFLWAGGPATAQHSAVVGERGAADIEVDPWPSDHRAVVSTFEVRPAPAPVLVSAAAAGLVTVGEPLQVSVHRPGDDGERLLLVGPRVADSREVTLPAGPAGAVEVPTTGLAPGPYRLVLQGADGARLADTSVHLQAPGQRPALRVPEDPVPSGTPVSVCWRRAPGNRHDWVAVAPRGEGTSGYVNYLYTGGTVSGCGRFDATTDGGGTWPLPPGRYSLYLALDDGYRELAATTVTVTRR